MDKKKIVALAAGTLVAGMLSTQGLQAMTDYCNHGSGSAVRGRLLNNEEPLAACPGGVCPRPKRPPEEGKKQRRYNWRTTTARHEEGNGSEGSCGEGTCRGNPKPEEDEDDKSSSGACGEGTCK